MGPGVTHTPFLCRLMTGWLGKWQNCSQEGIKHMTAAVTGSLLWVHARDFKSWRSPGIPWTRLCFSFFCCCCFIFFQSWLTSWHFCVVTSSSRPFWVKLESCEYLLISCLEGIWIFNHYYHPLSSLFYCIYVVLLVWLMFSWSNGKEGPNLKDFTVYLWDEEHHSHSTIWELVGSTRIMKPEEKEVSFRTYILLNLSVYWLALQQKTSVGQAWNWQQKCRKTNKHKCQKNSIHTSCT